MFFTVTLTFANTTQVDFNEKLRIMCFGGTLGRGTPQFPLKIGGVLLANVNAHPSRKTSDLADWIALVTPTIR